MKLDEIRLWQMMGYDEQTRRWICEGEGDEKVAKEKLRMQVNNVKVYGKWQNEIQAHVNEA